MFLNEKSVQLRIEAGTDGARHKVLKMKVIDVEIKTKRRVITKPKSDSRPINVTEVVVT